MGQFILRGLASLAIAVLAAIGYAIYLQSLPDPRLGAALKKPF